MSDMKPITLHGHSGGPNPWAIALLLEELNLPYEHKIWDFPDLKKENFESKLSPNGRVPVIEDPNTGITLWESGAILEYLEETYDKEHKFTETSSPQKWQLKQWLHFQVSGQGPYFGQRVWFMRYHPEQVKSAQDRYAGEIKRVISVIDKHLKATGSQYLIGDKYTYADLAFLPWNWLIPFACDESFEKELEKEFPTYWSWWTKISQRPASQKVMKDRQKAMSG
ncbi:hypothetical protein MBLNU457_g0498t1 [Dothideomycetes sp. NU457]